MAIAVENDFPGGTLDEYDGLLEQLGFHPQGRAEPGCLFHWVTKRRMAPVQSMSGNPPRHSRGFSMNGWGRYYATVA